MTIKEALEVLRKQYNCWTIVSIKCPIQCEKCENNVNYADFLEALKTVLDAFGNRSDIPNSSDLVSRSYLLAEYDRQHQGPPGGARKIIEEAPPVQACTSQTKFKPGSKFLLEIGEKRIELDEYEIVGTDLYVWGSLLEKLTLYEPNKDTISRQAAIDAIINTVSEIGLHDNSEVARYGATFRQHEIIDIIEGMPSAQPERKKNEWIEFDSSEDKYDVIKCPCCKHTFTVDSYHWTDIGFIKDDFKFCPNCGADMRGDADE